jgi:hypothetical protein
MQCHYEDCATFGRVLAVCNNGAFMELRGACTAVNCSGVHGTTCPAGQICVERIGGALIRECVPNSCGAGPISCDCLGLQCPGPCVITGAPEAGTIAKCNNCPANTCA